MTDPFPGAFFPGETGPASVLEPTIPATFRAATDDARSATTDATPALPAGVVAGDLLIAIQTSDLNGSLGAMSAPVGWTQIGDGGSRSDVGFMKVWTKVATSTEPAAYTFTDSTAAYGSTIIVAVTGHDPVTPLIVTPVYANGAASTSHVAPSVTGAVGALLICAAVAGTAGTTRDYSAPAGMSTAEESTTTTGGMILTGVWYESLASSAATGTKTATCTASTPWLAMSLVVGEPVPQTVTPTGVASREVLGSPTVTAAAASAQTVTPAGIAGSGAVGSPVVIAPGTSSGPLYPSEDRYPSETLYPSDGGIPVSQTVVTVGFDALTVLGAPVVAVDPLPAQTVTPTGIDSGEAFGTSVVSLADGPQTVSPTPIDSGEAFGSPTVTAATAAQFFFPFGITTGEALGRPTVTISFAPPAPSGPSYHDSYWLDGVDLSSLVSQIEVAEGLQDVVGTVGENVVLPGLDGELAVFGEPGQPRRTDGAGKITFNMWMFGVSPSTGEVTVGDHPAEDWFREWDKVVRLFRRRRLTLDHPRPDGTRRAIAHYAVGESMEPTSRSAGSPWFGRFKAVLTIPGAHWTDIDPVTTGTLSLANNASFSLGAFFGATAPCTELVVTFGPGNNPRISTGYNHIGYNGTIAPGQQLSINTATGLLGTGAGSSWAPSYANLTLSPGPRLFEIDPSEPLSAVLTHTGGGSMSVEVSGKRRYRTS